MMPEHAIRFQSDSNLVPHVELLQSLVPSSSLAQKDTLCKAIRHWVILDAIYRKPWSVQPPLTYSEWREQLSMADTMKSTLNWTEDPFDIKVVPLKHWLVFLGGVSETEWIHDFISVTGFAEEKAMRWLQEILPYGHLRRCELKLEQYQSRAEFDCTCQHHQRTVAVAKFEETYHIHVFNRSGKKVIDCPGDNFRDNAVLIERLDRAFEKPEQYMPDQKTQKKPFKGHQLIQYILSATKSRKEHRKFLRNDFTELVRTELILSENYIDEHGQAQKMQIFSPLDDVRDVKSKLKLDRFQASKSRVKLNPSQAIKSEQLSAITIQYLNPIQGVQRFFLDLNYIVDGDGGDVVEQLKTFLYSHVWNIGPIPPLLQLSYASASTQKTQTLIIYPVAISYFRRAAYLRAYGQSPYSKAHEIQFYNFRMDRIREVQVLSDLKEKHQIPQQLLEQYQSKTGLPTPKTFQEEMDLAWGFDLSRPIEGMLLRFKRQYHDAYIEGSERHLTFMRITPRNLNEFSEIGMLTKVQQQSIQTQMEQDEGDVFYHAFFRAIDNNVVMDLRSWGPQVEVLYPPALRQRLQADLAGAIAMYQ